MTNPKESDYNYNNEHQDKEIDPSTSKKQQIVIIQVKGFDIKNEINY
jgi:hypothetical protein